MLEGHSDEKGLIQLLGAIACDSEDNEVKRIGLGGLDFKKEFLGRGELSHAAVVGCEGKLPTQISDLIDPELRHEGYYPSLEDIGQGESQPLRDKLALGRNCPIEPQNVPSTPRGAG